MAATGVVLRPHHLKWQAVAEEAAVPLGPPLCSVLVQASVERPLAPVPRSIRVEASAARRLEPPPIALVLVARPPRRADESPPSGGGPSPPTLHTIG